MSSEIYFDPGSRVGLAFDGLRSAMESELQALDRYILSPGMETHRQWKDRMQATHQMYRSVFEAHFDRIVSVVEHARNEVLDVQVELGDLRREIQSIKDTIQKEP